MEWRDEAIILSVRGHGETSAIAEVFCAGHGRVNGLVRGGRSRTSRPMLQPGNLVAVTWRARLEDHLGNFVLEPLNLRAGLIIENALRLSGLSSLTCLAQVLPEREPHPKLYEAMRVVLETIDDDHVWPALMVRWEMGLLDELGFGLDLTTCVATGSVDDLVYVSPRSGRAVSGVAGKPYHERLFGLPGFLRGESGAPLQDVMAGLKLTGHFLERHVLGPRNMVLPQGRAMMQRALMQLMAA